MRQWLRPLILTLLALLALMLGLGAGGLALLIYRPGLFINAENVRWALAQMKSEVQVTFKDFDLTASSESLWKKKFHLTSTDLCVRIEDPHRVHFCAQTLQIEVKINFQNFGLRIEGPPTLLVLGGELDVALKPAPAPENSQDLPLPPEPRFDAVFAPLLSVVPEKNWGHLKLELRRLDVRISDSIGIKGTATVTSLQPAGALSLQTDLQVRSPLSEKDQHVHGEAHLDLHQRQLTALISAPEYHQLQLKLLLNETLAADVLARLRGRTAAIDLSAKILAQGQRIDIYHQALINLTRPHFLKSRKIPLPKIDVSQDLHIEYALSEKLYDFQLNLKTQSPSVSGIALDSEVKAAFQWKRGAELQSSLRLHEFKIDLRIPELRAMVKNLAWTLLQVPAPFYRMQGPIHLSLASSNPDLRKGQAEAHLQADLKDGLQSIQLELPATITFENILKPERQVGIRGQLNIKTLVLELPRLSLLGLPRFVLDSRIRKSPRVKPSLHEGQHLGTNASGPPSAVGKVKLHWSLDLQIHTPEKPLLLHSNLFSEPVPIQLQNRLVMGTSIATQYTGSIQVLPMGLELFRRHIQVEKIRIDRRSNALTAIDGLLSYSTSEVKVRIRLLGTTESPQVVWESDPPLSQRQIIAIIVFGKSLNELTQEETNSAQNLERAFADGALGVASLFLLASTPIESVSYDPISQSYAARLKIDSRTSLSLGSDFDEKQQLSIRRQLGGAWSIKTELQSTAEDKDQLSTFLEWFQRF